MIMLVLCIFAIAFFEFDSWCRHKVGLPPRRKAYFGSYPIRRRRYR